MLKVVRLMRTLVVMRKKMKLENLKIENYKKIIRKIGPADFLNEVFAQYAKPGSVLLKLDSPALVDARKKQNTVFYFECYRGIDSCFYIHICQTILATQCIHAIRHIQIGISIDCTVFIVRFMTFPQEEKMKNLFQTWCFRKVLAKDYIWLAKQETS